MFDFGQNLIFSIHKGKKCACFCAGFLGAAGQNIEQRTPE
jgi:hypothetical protein